MSYNTFYISRQYTLTHLAIELGKTQRAVRHNDPAVYGCTMFTSGDLATVPGTLVNGDERSTRSNGKLPTQVSAYLSGPGPYKGKNFRFQEGPETLFYTYMYFNRRVLDSLGTVTFLGHSART